MASVLKTDDSNRSGGSNPSCSAISPNVQPQKGDRLCYFPNVESMTDEQVERYKAMFAKPIDSKEAEVLDPIIEKHSKVTISDLSGENAQKFSLDDVRKEMGIETGEKEATAQEAPAGAEK